MYEDGISSKSTCTIISAVKKTQISENDGGGGGENESGYFKQSRYIAIEIHTFFYRIIVYKNIEVHILPKFKNISRI